MTKILKSAYHSGLLILHDQLDAISYFKIGFQDLDIKNSTIDIEKFAGPLENAKVTALSISSDYFCFAIDCNIEVYCRRNYKFLKLLKRLSTDSAGLSYCNIIIRSNEVIGLTEAPSDVYAWILHQRNTSGDEGSVSYPYKKREINHISYVKEIFKSGQQGYTAAVRPERDIAIYHRFYPRPTIVADAITALHGRGKSPHIRIDQLCRHAILASYPASYDEYRVRRVPDLHVYHTEFPDAPGKPAACFKKACDPFNVSKIPPEMGLFLDFTVDADTIVYFFESGICRVILASKQEEELALAIEQILLEQSSSRELVLNSNFVSTKYNRT